MKSVIPGGIDSCVRGRGCRGWGKGLRVEGYHRIPGTLGFYVIPTWPGGEPKQCQQWNTV